MSRDKEVLRWLDESGREYRSIRWSKSPNPARSLAQIPTSERLLDLYCTRRHWIGVVTLAEGAMVVVCPTHDGPPSPFAVLDPDGVSAVLGTTEGWHRFGEPRPSMPVSCWTCRADYQLAAEDHRSVPDTPVRRVPRLALPVVL